MKRVLIKNLKNIPYLEFQIPGTGVWLLTGENGTGKTTLLACLRRIGYRNAFPVHFPTSAVSDRLDSYEDSTVTYTLRKRSVTYSYGQERWVPRPRSNASLLKDFGYADVVYVGATAERITPKPEDFNVQNVRPAPADIKEAANKILGSDKFSNLRKVNVTRGVNPAFVFSDGGRRYFSEKNFSLGELCVLKLLERLRQISDSSLIIVDELEMALHPSAQVRLFYYLEKVARDHGHTIIFSTHSVSLVKTAKREQIIYLKKGDGRIDVELKPFPSVVLGGLAYVEEKSADIVVYVEDEMAEYASLTLLSLVLAEKLKDEAISLPQFQVVPIGGFSQVVSFLKKHNALHRPSVRSFALLDADVKDENVKEWKARNDYQKLAWFDEYKGQIKYLPWTVETAFVEAFHDSEASILTSLREAIGQNQLRFDPSLDCPERQCKRGDAKVWVRETVNFWGDHFGVSESDARKAIGQCLARAYFSKNKVDAMRLFAGIFA